MQLIIYPNTWPAHQSILSTCKVKDGKYMLKFIIAPDSFKGTMSSTEICQIIETCIHELAPESLVVKVPVADGSEGLVDAYLA